MNKKTVRKVQLTTQEPFQALFVSSATECDEKMDLKYILQLPEDFRPKTLSEMKNPTKVYGLNKHGKISTFPRVFSYMIEKQAKLLEKYALDSSNSKVKSKTIKKKRLNLFEGPKGVTLPRLNINWARQCTSINMNETLNTLRRNKELNSEGSNSMARLFIANNISNQLIKKFNF